MEKQISFTVNGKKVSLVVESQWTLTSVLRNQLGLTGTKEGCGEGECGSCTVLVDDAPVNSCLYLAINADGKSITTIEGLADGNTLHPLQQAFVDRGAIQCGFCTPGMVMTAKAMLDEKKKLTAEDIRYYMSGNLCRCTGYSQIFDAIIDVRKQMENDPA
ncbi:MAG: (2Fe-2S)-binding protein [Deltaproteobacteria bacterium]|nr:MAG: (2Fe-2S)-binding protein [Deltaproteobacteria bacterium]